MSQLRINRKKVTVAIVLALTTIATFIPMIVQACGSAGIGSGGC